MDDTTRRLEREALEGDPGARVRLARHQLRAGRHDEVLRLTEGDATGEAAAVRANCLVQLARWEEAASAAALAEREAPGQLEPDLLLRIGERLLAPADPSRPPDALERARALARCAALGDGVAALLAEQLPDEAGPLLRAQAARVPALAASLRDDPSPWVRHVARGAPPLPAFEREPTPTRLFSAHGPDFQVGLFVAFEASCEARLRYFDGALFEEVAGLLERPLRLSPALGLGYGLGLPASVPRGDLEERVAEVNAAGVLPFPLRTGFGQPFDWLADVEPAGTAADEPLSPLDRRLARRFAHDLAQHPARLGAPAGAPPFARILARFRPGPGDAPPLPPLLEEARAAYGPVGMRALEQFVAVAGAEGPTRGEGLLRARLRY